MKFPMILTHRTNRDAQIVVVNAEQLAEVPADFLPPADTSTPAVVTAASAIPGVNLDAGTIDTPEDAERRKSLDEAVDEFTAHVAAETAKIDAARAQLDADRAELVKQAAALAEQSEALTRERATFEAQRLIETSGAGTGETDGDAGTASSAAEGAVTGDAATPPAAPARRTRTAAAKADATGTEGA